MKYYLNTVEQTVNSDGVYSEYSKSDKQTDLQTAKPTSSTSARMLMLTLVKTIPLWQSLLKILTRT